YLALLVVLLAVAFAFPGLIGSGGAYRPGQAVAVAALTVVLYGFFLVRRTGAQRADFQAVRPSPAAAAPQPRDPGAEPGPAGAAARHRPEVVARTLLLVATVLPIVLLSHDMAALLDDGFARAGAPVALSGVVIAMIVFLPETITTVRAALGGEIQRVSNLCHGALVSTAARTVPAGVLTIGLVTGQRVVLAESPAHLVLLGTSLLLTAVTFGGRRVTALHGSAHLMVFVLYGLAVFS